MKVDSAHIERLRLPIQGMECAACAVRLERQLNRPDDVISATVNYATHEATIHYGRGALSRDDLSSIVSKSGFAVGPVDSDADANDIEQASFVRLRNRLALSTVLTVPIVVLSMVPWFASDLLPWILLVLTTPVVLIAGGPFYSDAWNALRHGSANMNSLIALGVGAAYLFSIVVTVAPDTVAIDGMAHVYYEAAAMIITLILAGRVLEAMARKQTGRAIRRLMSLQPDEATLIDDGVERIVRIDQVNPGDVLVLKPGERVAVDGEVLDGETDVDESMLTGEPMPVSKYVGANVSAGTINLTGSVRYRATRTGSETVLQRIIDRVRSAQGNKPPIQRLADRIAGVFVPVVLIIAVISLIGWLTFGPVPALRFGLVAFVSVLIIACPCALGLATPTAIMVGTGRAAAAGIFIKGGDVLERLHEVNLVILDKTGTITSGTPHVLHFETVAHFSKQEVLRFAGSVELRSEHPIGQAIVREARHRGIAISDPAGFTAHIGGGVTGRVNEHNIVVGSPHFVRAQTGASREVNADLPDHTPATVITVAIDGHIAGSFALIDEVRPTSADAIAQMQQLGIAVVMATGDAESAARFVGSEVGISDIHANTSPGGKADLVLAYQKEGYVVALVGDGINDAPALATADVGIAVGSGTDVALETADVALMRNDLTTVVDAMETSRQTMRVIRQNLFFAFVYNMIGIPVAAGVLYPLTGLMLNPMIAAAAMALSSLSVVGNSLRLKAKETLS